MIPTPTNVGFYAVARQAKKVVVADGPHSAADAHLMADSPAFASKVAARGILPDELGVIRVTRPTDRDLPIRRA